MKSEKKTGDIHLSKLRKRMKTVGILMLISIVLGYLWYLYMSLPTNPPTGLFTPMPVRIYSFFFHSLSLLYIIVGIKMIRGKCLNLSRYLFFIVILEILFVVFIVGVLLIWAGSPLQFSVSLQELPVILLLILPLTLPLIGYKLFKEAIRNKEYRKTFIQESRFQKIFFVLLILIFLIGLAISIYNDYFFILY